MELGFQIAIVSAISYSLVVLQIPKPGFWISKEKNSGILLHVAKKRNYVIKV